MMPGGEFDVRKLDELLDHVRYDVSPAEAKRAIRSQFEQLIELLTPAEGSAVEAAYQVLHRAFNHFDSYPRCANCEGYARQLVAAVGAFPRYNQDVPA